ncbi:hybrid sensor histidine kinase/response regulator [Chrysiogenes arsenatis]|uniref:hybrid sensor histidine kinase/response regulator n=1 Tax=Chrysiogenes arsenatis TaxID=309797 RepID=UPI00041344D7|nr:response regulator [Chrysiogenes arsenatis]
MNKEKPKILIVDDMPTNVEILATALKDEYHILVATDGNTALSMAQMHIPDCILLDIIMPVMNGYEVLRRLKGNPQTNGIPVIFVTGKNDDNDEEMGLSMGAVDYIVKPFRASLVRARIKTQVRLHFQELRLSQFNEELQNRVAEEMAARSALVHEREIEQQVLIQQSKMADLGNMMGAIAHQWKQPLNIIGIAADELLESFELQELDEDRVRELHDMLVRQVQFMAQTVQDFQEFFKPSTECVAFDLTKAVCEVMELLKGQMMRSYIEVNFLQEMPVIIQGFPSEFKQVILNILNNARDALLENTPAQRTITIAVQTTDTEYRLLICDNAGGIPNHLLPNGIFEPFVSTKGKKGTGIGLSLARKIIEKMNGTITAANIDGGAEFTLTLPR